MVVAALGFLLFCNGYVLAETEGREEELFFQKWKSEVEESQTSKFGKVMMSMFYFIPTAGAICSWCKNKLTHLERESL